MCSSVVRYSPNHVTKRTINVILTVGILVLAELNERFIIIIIIIIISWIHSSLTGFQESTGQ
jgi:hypothetical protein